MGAWVGALWREGWRRGAGPSVVGRSQIQWPTREAALTVLSCLPLTPLCSNPSRGLGGLQVWPVQVERDRKHKGKLSTFLWAKLCPGHRMQRELKRSVT